MIDAGGDKANAKKTKRKRVVTTKPSSGACNTCRQRRVKCDESRPYCQRCAFAGRKCLGYRSAVLPLETGELFQTLALQDDASDIAIKPESPSSEPSLWTGTPIQTHAMPYMTILPIAKLDVRPLEQLQMLTAVLEDHFPSNRPEAAFARRASYLARLPAMDMSSSLVSNAVDSLCLAHFGRRSADEALLIASRQCYTRALSSLARLINLMQTSKDYEQNRHRMVISSIMLVSLYDESLPLQDRLNNNWETHYTGIDEYLKRIGPAALQLQSREEANVRLYQNLRMPLYFLALSRRKRLAFAEPQWAGPSRIKASDRIYTKVSTDWYALAAPLPGLLEEADGVVQSAADERLFYSALGIGEASMKTERLAKLFQKILRLREELLLWLSYENSVHNPQMISLADVDAFDSSIEEHLFITSTGLFQEFPYYQDATMIVRATVVHLSCLIANCTLLGLISLRQRDESHSLHLEKDWSTVEYESFCQASAICTTVYGYSKLRSLAQAHVLYTMLSVARAFFSEYGARDELEWTTNCMFVTKMRIQRIEKTEPPTLCRMANLGTSLEALLSSVRYRGEVCE